MKTKEASPMASLALGEPKTATVFFFERQIRRVQSKGLSK
jgi:hypothetical protein